MSDAPRRNTPPPRSTELQLGHGTELPASASGSGEARRSAQSARRRQLGRTLRPGVQAIIFDFDGVIANSEPLHLRAFQAALEEDGLTLTSEEYYGRYLGYDDVGFIRELSRDRGIAPSQEQVAALLARKGARLRTLTQSGAVLFPGAAEFIRHCAAVMPVAIASGALKHEILEIVGAAGLADLFGTVVASGDTPESKPSPDPYRLAFERLRELSGLPLAPGRTVAIEDSRWGLASARGAGLRCVGVTSSYPAHELPGAELTVGGLADLTLEQLDALCATDRCAEN